MIVVTLLMFAGSLMVLNGLRVWFVVCMFVFNLLVYGLFCRFGLLAVCVVYIMLFWCCCCFVWVVCL